MRKRKLSTRILTPVVVVTIIFSIVFYLLGALTFNRLIENSLDEMVSAKVVEIENRQRQIADKVLSEAALFSNAEAVIEAYEEAHKGNLTVADDPASSTARRKLRDYFASIEKGYVAALGVENFRIHFHLPSIRSLLRLWKTEQNRCDDLSSFRETIKTIAISPHSPLTGIEIGRGGFAIRGLAPIIASDGRYLGSVEVLSSYTPLVENSIANQNESIAVYMNSEFLPIASRLQDSSKYPLNGGKFVRVTSTAVDLSKRLISADLLERGKTAIVKEYREDFLLTAFPVKDFQNRQIGVIVYVYDAGERFALRDQIQWGVAIISLILLLLICTVLILVLKTVTQPLVRGSSGLKESADQVTSAAHEISSSSHSLAESSSEQAAAVEETGASVEEIASMARHNADNANSANSLAQQMGQATVGGKDVIARMSTAVNEIKKSSDDTAKIIKVIEEIAFQTNLLALNAAVEAARAGEAGAGFAVVADEVRSLAKRSAESAAETSRLIEESVSKADHGVKLAVEVDKVLGEVVGHVSKVKELVAEIAAASGEQAEGIYRITNSIGEIERLTQGNAATAEECAAAAEELNAQAETMRAMTSEINQVIGGTSAGSTGSAYSLAGDFNRPKRSLPRPVARPKAVEARPLTAPASQKVGKPRKPSPEKIIPFDDNDSFDNDDDFYDF